MNAAYGTPNRNVSAIRDPNWTGDPNEYVIVVSRGEPRRTDTQMQQGVYSQATRYVKEFLAELAVSDVALALAVQLIANDYITPGGAQQVTLSRSHFLAFLDVAQKKLNEAAHDA